MRHGVWSIIAVLVITCASTIDFSNHASSKVATLKAADLQQVADLPPMVRLRRLHLVRPDLIPYPIEVEIVC
jgi:hypothetical protein